MGTFLKSPQGDILTESRHKPLHHWMSNVTENCHDCLALPSRLVLAWPVMGVVYDQDRGGLAVISKQPSSVKRRPYLFTVCTGNSGCRLRRVIPPQIVKRGSRVSGALRFMGKTFGPLVFTFSLETATRTS